MSVPPILNICRHDTGNRALVTLTGEIDLNSAPLVHAFLYASLPSPVHQAAHRLAPPLPAPPGDVL